MVPFMISLALLATRCAWRPSYVAAQGLASEMLNAGSLCLVYPSERYEGGTCIACFRPAIVGNVRPDRRYRFTWNGAQIPRIYTASVAVRCLWCCSRRQVEISIADFFENER